ncbi:glycoside hydrolase family 13 protein [Anaerolineales bacterium HSG25]|nr:glycoside hydrolase family 13 protein [Anaerolineales bacterium HSG25]
MTINTPEWVKHAVFYQIYPDRFARSPRAEPPLGTQFKPWGTPPQEQGFQGGDLYGVVDKLDYLQDLGITAIYFNPIFSSASNHRYHTFDYMQVDPLLGGNEALRELLDEAHARDMKVMLDGVFNHASRGFWAFHHILETGGNSPYLDWFIIDGWPLRPYTSDKDNPTNYSAWWDLPALPKLNTDNLGVRAYIMEVARYWLEFGIDGWRLDVPAEIDDDSFWQEFRQVVKGVNPEAYICGEIWVPAQRWLQGDQFDAVMNYLFSRAAMSFFGARTLNKKYDRDDLTIKAITAPAMAKKIDEMHDLYDWAINQVQLNLLDSHDTARALWIMGNDKSALKLCLLFQMTMPGAPCIYYGDEIGLSTGDDPHCREAFPWHKPETWDNDLLTFYQQATELRHAHPVLRTGSFEKLYATGKIYGFVRRLDDEIAIVLFNSGIKKKSVRVKVDGLTDRLQGVWPTENKTYPIKGGKITIEIPARGVVVAITTEDNL